MPLNKKEKQLLDQIAGSKFGGDFLANTTDIGDGLSNTVCADSNASTSGDGSYGFPFKSLQAAVTAAESLGLGTRKIILVAAGSAFDEDVTISGGFMTIMGLGPFTLGDAALDKFDSTTPRNLTYNASNPNVSANKWHSLVLGTIMDDETSSTHTSYLNGFIISGDLTFNEIAGQSRNCQLRNVKVQGDYVQTGIGGVQTYLRRCFFDNGFTGSSTILNVADSCEFDQLVTVIAHNRIWQCEFAAGMTTGSLINSLSPNGMYHTNFKGTFTGPAGSLLLDPVTNYFFNINGATLGGAATKVLLHDEVL